ncbi:MAG TPA: hypothetical protein PLU37_10320 [Chitinophagaceae bacterium]|nr:hypothetical protein [Chitinophagales bacterium]HPG11916.1 hypothetical protein [Chitinophagaceae bacterium]
MKRRIRKVVNFFAFNLLFFALYLNFIHSDNSQLPATSVATHTNAPAFSGTVLVENPEHYIPAHTVTATILPNPADDRKAASN